MEGCLMPHKTYITCASWEDRFIQSIFEDFKKYNFNKIVLFYFHEKRFLNLSKKNIDKVQIFATKNNIIIEQIGLAFDDQIEIYNKSKKVLSTLNSTNHYLNIATMPRHLIYISLDLLTAQNCKFKVLYYIPESYGKEIAKNPNMPQLMIKHSGIFAADKETLLIVSSGLDTERIFQLYYYFEPYKTIILEERKNYSEIKKEDRLNMQKSLSEISNLDFFEIDSFTENNIFYFMEKDLKDEINKYNTLLCAIGPKIASLEFFKFNKQHPNTGIAYALSRDYSKDYSVGIDKKHTFARSSDFFI